MTRKVAVIGSTTFPLGTAVGAEVVDTIRGFGDNTAILTRGSGPFEAFVAHVALALGIRCFEYRGTGGPDNLVREADLVADCDEVVAFLDPACLDAPYTGTGMFVERALNAKKPTRVATVSGGSLVWADG